MKNLLAIYWIYVMCDTAFIYVRSEDKSLRGLWFNFLGAMVSPVLLIYNMARLMIKYNK